jgi:hypothetical protein
MEKFTTCKESARNYLVLGREGQTKSPALTFGGALHAGLEKFLEWQYTAQTQQEGTAKDVSAYGSDAQDLAIVKHFCENPLPLDLFPDYRTVESCLEVMKHYRFQAQLPDYQWEILSDENGPVIERAFELPLGVLEVNAEIEMPWLYDSHVISWHEHKDRPRTTFVSHIHVAWSGRIDAAVHANGMARICDHKTASDKRYLNPQKYHMASQTMGYVWAAKQLFPTLDIRGFVLNGIIFRKPTGSGSIFEKGPRGGEPALTFSRYYYEYSDQRLLWWANNTLTIVSDFVHCLVRNEFTSETVWCHGTYGACPYLEVCEQDNPALREALIQSDRYKTVTWNPVK